MNRAEAQALAEREVLEYARMGKIAEAAKARGQTELEYAFGALLGGLPAVEQGLRSGAIYDSDLSSLAALIIEFLRECHLRYYNREGASGPTASGARR